MKAEEIIRKAINESGKSQGKIAKSMDISPASFSRSIRSDMQISTLLKIMHALGYKVYAENENGTYEISE